MGGDKVNMLPTRQLFNRKEATMPYQTEEQFHNKYFLCSIGGSGDWDDGAASDQGNGDSSGDVGNDL